MSTVLRRSIAVGLIALAWVVALLGSLAALLCAYLGRMNWGNGQDPDSWALTILFVALAVLAPLVAFWVTRIAWRRT